MKNIKCLYWVKNISLRITIKACILLALQKIVYFWWKYFDNRKSRVFSGNNVRIEKRGCPIIYLKEKGYETIAVDLFFTFGVLKKL